MRVAEVAMTIRVTPSRRGVPFIIRGSQEATEVLNLLQNAVGVMDNVVGLNTTPACVRRLHSVARYMAHGRRFRGDMRRNLYGMVNALDKALHANAETIYVEDGTRVELLLRHELTHTGQRKLGSNGRIGGHIHARSFLRCPAARKARAALIDRGYPDNPDVLAAEIGAHLVEGDTGREALGLSAEEGTQLAYRYRRALERQHGRGIVRFPELGPVLELAAVAGDAQ
jgi:hypothetical protein